jgi:uncharacterized protein (TIGR03437 family)
MKIITKRLSCPRPTQLLAMCCFIAAVLGLNPAYSQTVATCAPTASAFVVRSEGITERVGDIVLSCSGGTPGATFKGNLTVFLNVNVTNKLVGNDFTDILLTIDTGSGPTPANATAQPLAPTAVVFNGLSFTVPASGNVTLRVTNLRANASQVGSPPQQPIIASLAFSGSAGLSVSSAQFTVGITQPGLLAAYSSGGVSCTGSPLPSILNIRNLFAVGTNFFSTRVTEGFADAFQVKDQFSDTGTRIMVNYSGFPAGAQLFVPDYVAGSSAVQPTAGGDLGVPASGGQYAPSAAGSLLLVLVTGADQNGSGGAIAFPTPGPGVTSFNSVSPVTLANGAGNAVYEVVDSNPSVQESAQFPTFLGLAPFGSGVGTVANMAVSFAPISTVFVASPGPIPRFVDVTPPSDCAALNDCNASYFPHLEVDSPVLNFTAPVNAFLQTAYVRVHNNGGGLLSWTATIAYQSGSGWLTADPPSGPDDATIRVDAHPSAVSPGTYQATLTVDAGPLAGSRSIPVTFTVTGSSSQGPTVGAIVNAASFQAGALAAGSLASITGSNLGGSNVAVTFDGTPATLLYTSGTQINLRVPSSLAGKSSTQVVVTVNGQSSAPQTLPLAMVAPAIFNPGILNQDGKVNAAANPAAPGTVIQIFATGLASTGSGAITARIAGQNIAKPYYGGPAPGIPGVQQVNLTIPAGLAPGAAQVEVCAVATDPAEPVCSLPASVTVK